MINDGISFQIEVRTPISLGVLDGKRFENPYHRWLSCPGTQPQLSVVLGRFLYLIHLLTCFDGHHSVPVEVVCPPLARCGCRYERNVWFCQSFDDSTMTDLQQIGSLEVGRVEGAEPLHSMDHKVS